MSQSNGHRTPTPIAPDPAPPRIDHARAERAVADLLDALGVDRTAEGVRATPRRVASAFAELLEPVPFRATTFPNEGGYDELVVVSDIAFSSLCEHHLLPFTGVAHVGYLPGDRIVGLSKLPRLVEHRVPPPPGAGAAHRPRSRSGSRRSSRRRAVGVVLEATHMCMSLRGVRQPGAVTTTSALRGRLREDPRTRQEFLELIGRRGRARGPHN